jgi:2-dehydro-3-deoxyphosphogluconate aldolase / (4S)-4-hydroxy-2-oxoglutarate aldolase
MNKAQIIERIKQQGILPLFYHADKTVCIDIVKTLYANGITVIEFTNRGEAALDNFKAIAALKNESMPNLLLAAGTIKTSVQANAFLEAGASFLISPVFDEEIYNTIDLQKTLWIPGCMTPTEIHTATKAGCNLIKLFPGNVLGPGFMSAVKELFPGVDFMPTGGVDATKENMGVWFTAGVCAVGMGSRLIDHEILDKQDYALLAQRVKQVQAIVDDVKRQSA